MSETAPEGSGAGRDDDDTGVSAGVPGPSGTGEATAAGGDPAAPAATSSEETQGE